MVIGILVALQINTLNQDHERKKLEKVLLDQIRFELLESYGDIWRDATNLENGSESYTTILKVIEDDGPYVQNHCFDFHWLPVDEYFYPAVATYGRLKEEGLDIVTNDSIRVCLQTLYEGYFPRLSKNSSSLPDISEAFNDYYLENFKPNTDFELEYYQELPIDTVGQRIYSDVSYNFPIASDSQGNQYTIGYVPLDFGVLKRDPKFRMLMERTRGHRNNKIRYYGYAESIIKMVVPMIDKELEGYRNK